MTKEESPWIEQDEFAKVLENYLNDKHEFDEAKKKFDNSKKVFNQIADAYLEARELKQEEMTFDDAPDVIVKVIKVVPSKVEFDIPKLKASLGKRKVDLILKRQYDIVDIDGLVSYLKEFNVDPRIFKSFLNVIEEVDKDELEQMEQLGEIEKDELSGCYEITYNAPYFRVTERRNERGEE